MKEYLSFWGWLHLGWSSCCTGAQELTSQSNIAGLVLIQINLPKGQVKNNLCLMERRDFFSALSECFSVPLLLRTKKELGKYQFVWDELSVDAEEEDRDF